MANVYLTIYRFNGVAKTPDGTQLDEISVIPDNQDAIIDFIASDGYYITDLDCRIGGNVVGSYTITPELKKLRLTIPAVQINGNITIQASANVTAIEECILNPNSKRVTDHTKILLPLSIPKKDKVVYFTENNPTDISNIVTAESPDLVEYNETLYYKKKSSLGIYSYEEVSSEVSSEQTSNKVTSISSSSTDIQYPSAKCVYDLVGNITSLMEVL